MASTFVEFANQPIAAGSFRGWWPWRTRREQQRSLLRLIAVGTEERLPLAPLLEAWAEDERGVQRRRVRRLARLLARGVALPEAVEQVPNALSDNDVLAIRFGAQSGSLAATLRDALVDAPASGQSNIARWRRTVAYHAGVIVAAIAIVTFLMIKIVPSFLAIYQDFDLNVPRALVASIVFNDAVSSYWFVVALPLLLAAWLAFTVRGGRVLRNAIAGRLFGSVRELRSADLLDQLSVAAGAGRPLAGALSTLARYHFDPAMRRKLLFIRNEVEQGAEMWQSMTTAGLIAPPEGALLRTADRVGNRAWVLRTIAAGKRRRTHRWLQRLSDLFLPAVTLLIGAFVLFQSAAIFAPLVDLIANLAA